MVDHNMDELDDNLCIIEEVYLQAKQMPFCFVFTPCLSMSSYNNEVSSATVFFHDFLFYPDDLIM